MGAASGRGAGRGRRARPSSLARTSNATHPMRTETKAISVCRAHHQLVHEHDHHRSGDVRHPGGQVGRGHRERHGFREPRRGSRREGSYAQPRRRDRPAVTGSRAVMLGDLAHAVARGSAQCAKTRPARAGIPRGEQKDGAGQYGWAGERVRTGGESRAAPPPTNPPALNRDGAGKGPCQSTLRPTPPCLFRALDANAPAFGQRQRRRRSVAWRRGDTQRGAGAQVSERSQKRKNAGGTGREGGGHGVGRGARGVHRNEERTRGRGERAWGGQWDRGGWRELSCPGDETCFRKRKAQLVCRRWRRDGPRWCQPLRAPQAYKSASKAVKSSLQAGWSFLFPRPTTAGFPRAHTLLAP